MHSTGSYLYTLLERIRAYLDEPDLDAKYNDDWIVRHAIGPSQVDVLARLWTTQQTEILLIQEITLDPEIRLYRLPPCVQQVKRLVMVDEDGVPTYDAIPRDLMHRNGPGWSLQGNPGAMLLRIEGPPIGSESAQVWYLSNGDMMPHYAATGAAVNAISVVGADWDEDTRTLTKTSGFTNYEFIDGDRITITVATGGTIGDYDIESRIDQDNIVLKTGIGAGATGIAGRLWCWGMTLAATPTLGALDLREGAYNGMPLRLLPGSGVRTQEVQIDTHYFVPPNIWRVTTRTPFDPGAAPTTMVYEVAPAGSNALYEAITLASAMRLGTARRISQANQQSLQLAYRMSIKTIGDNLTNAQGRVPRHIEKDTVDNPLNSTIGWSPLR